MSDPSCRECQHPMSDHDPDDDRIVCTFEGQPCDCGDAFETAWRKLGYQYGADALENVRLGWGMAAAEIARIRGDAQAVAMELRSLVVSDTQFSRAEVVRILERLLAL